MSIPQVAPNSAEIPGRRRLQMSSRRRRELAQQAALEREWLHKEKDPRIREELRIERTVEAIMTALERFPSKEGLRVLDLGCGDGEILSRLPKYLDITATDAATNALRRVERRKLSNVRTRVEPLPLTSLPDKGFDLVLCTHVLAELPSEDHRLLISELSRLVTPLGVVILSSDLDVRTDGAAEKLEQLVNTELRIEARYKSYHGMLIRAEKILPFLAYRRAAALLLEKLARICNRERNLSHIILETRQRPL